MKRPRYKISGWTIWALVVTPFAIVAAMVVIAALEQPQTIEIDPKAPALQGLVFKVLPQIGPAPAGKKE